MNILEIFDPALCCSSGVCGPSPDAELAAFAANLEALKSAGVSVKRNGLAQEPLAFAQNPLVKTILETEGESALPLTLINGNLHFRGVYPTKSQLAQLLDLDLSEAKEKNDVASAPISFVKVSAPAPKSKNEDCCDPSTGCC